VIVADSGALYALYDADDASHDAVRDAVGSTRETFSLPAACLGELDYMLRTRLGIAAELDFLIEVERGRFVIEQLTLSDARNARALIEKYRKLDIGLADAAVAVTAERLKTRRLLTIDRRDFEAIRASDGTPFEIIVARPSKRRRH